MGANKSKPPAEKKTKPLAALRPIRKRKDTQQPRVARRSRRIQARRASQSQEPKPEAERQDAEPQDTEPHEAERQEEHSHPSTPANESEIEPLKAENERLNRRLDQLDEWTAGMLQKYNFQEAAHCGWGYGSPNKWADSAATIFDELHNWAVKYAHWDAKVLTEKQRKDLLASIDEYCIQDDLEVILSGLPGQLHTAFVPDLVGMFLIKDCLARFFHNPLWYLVPRLPSDEGDSARAMPPTASGFGADAFTLYQNLLTTHPIYANCWRLWTARLSTPNISPKEVNVNNSFGQAMAAHREHIVDKMCTDLLKHDILQPVIRPLESQKEIDIRIRQLQRVYKMAAKFAVGAACEVTRLEFWTLKQMDPYFHHSSEQARAALNHQLDKEGAKYRLDGQRILALRAPLIFLRGTIFDANSEKLVRKAEVIIEDHEG